MQMSRLILSVALATLVAGCADTPPAAQVGGHSESERCKAGAECRTEDATAAPSRADRTAEREAWRAFKAKKAQEELAREIQEMKAKEEAGSK